jgi:hypothetical protein
MRRSPVNDPRTSLPAGPESGVSERAAPERAASERVASPEGRADPAGPEPSDGRPLSAPDRSLWQARLEAPAGRTSGCTGTPRRLAADAMSADGFTRDSHIYLGVRLRPCTYGCRSVS